jgi:hypothetical protein
MVLGAEKEGTSCGVVSCSSTATTTDFLSHPYLPRSPATLLRLGPMPPSCEGMLHDIAS